MASDELWRKGAGELAELIRSGSVSSVEVVEAHLDRIAAVNDAVNAVTVVLAESALAAAREADAVRRGAGGPLHGVPFTIKENIDAVGSATTQGVPAMVDAVPSVDAPVVARMKAAGAIPLARTNLPEFGMRISTDNPLRGLTRNPWSPLVTAGGSSGGEASALATGMSPIGLGNDIGGSLRNPSFCCGTAAIKPTHGRVAMASAIPPLDPMAAAQVMATDGPMARRVADVRLGLSVLNGRDVRDPRSVDVPLDLGLGSEPAVRVAALVTDLGNRSLPPPFADAIRRAGAALEAAGWKVVEATPPGLDAIGEVWIAMMQLGVDAMIPMLDGVMTPEAVGLLQALMDIPAPSPGHAFVERHRLQREWSAFFVDHPVVVGPTWCDVQFPHGVDIDPVSGAETTLARLPFILPGNLLGIPGVAVPAGVSADGLPLGVQVYADLWQDMLALAVAETIESSLGTITPIDPITT